MLLCIDPGWNISGWAVFVGSCLVGCGCNNNAKIQRMAYDELVIERPQQYVGRRGLNLNPLRSAVDHFVTVAGFRKVTQLSPPSWKGQVPKQIHHVRIRRALVPRELEVVHTGCRGLRTKHRGDVWDAIGLGLFHTGRLGRGGARKLTREA